MKYDLLDRDIEEMSAEYLEGFKAGYMEACTEWKSEFDLLEETAGQSKASVMSYTAKYLTEVHNLLEEKKK